MTNPHSALLSLDARLYEPLLSELPLDTFSACLNARGVYESQRFALRLSPVIHEQVNRVVAKSEQGDKSFTNEELQAYSTYLHETVHWWQHKGSTSGFIRSILYPIQTHSNLSDLQQIAAILGPQKPIQTLALMGELGLLPQGLEKIGPVTNTVTNNFMDTEFYLALTLKPKLDLEIYDNPYFEAAGHSFLITYSLVIGAIRELIDSEGSLFPDPKALVDNLAKLAQQKVRGYYYTSEIIRAPVGLLDLYEGQARFIQLQFLALSLKGLTISEARCNGMLDGIYGSAFAEFLKLSESSEPIDIIDPLIALFLFICDMSINPTAGFPAPIEDYENFFLDADPGIRFAVLCKAIAKQAPELRAFVKNYSKEEYQELTQSLSNLTGVGDHLFELNRLDRHTRKNSEATKLIKEHDSFRFSRNNIVLQVLTGEFLAFVRDRLEFPEFFCWTGYWLTKGSGERQRDLWLKNLSLFSDKVDDGALFPRNHPSRSKDDVLEVFNQFYGAIILYDMSKQWVLNSGPFRLNYSWLTSSADDSRFIDRVKDLFRKHYGIDIDQFMLLDRPDISKK